MNKSFVSCFRDCRISVHGGISAPRPDVLPDRGSLETPDFGYCESELSLRIEASSRSVPPFFARSAGKFNESHEVSLLPGLPHKFIGSFAGNQFWKRSVAFFVVDASLCTSSGDAGRYRTSQSLLLRLQSKTVALGPAKRHLAPK